VVNDGEKEIDSVLEQSARIVSAAGWACRRARTDGSAQRRTRRQHGRWILVWTTTISSIRLT
jgi:hypothetical protein